MKTVIQWDPGAEALDYYIFNIVFILYFGNGKLEQIHLI